MNKTLTRIIGLCSLSFAVACGGTSFSSGVDGSKTVSELTDDDAKKICDAAEATAKDFADDNKEGFCKLGGAVAGGIAAAFGSDGAAACQMAVDDCLTKEPTASTGTCNPKVTDCTATVEEMETCYNDTLDAMGKLFDDIGSKDCAELVTGDPGSSLDVAAPASCTALQAKCPSLQYGVPSTSTSSTAG